MACPTLRQSVRVVVLIVSLLQSVIFAGIIFGWPAFSKMLEEAGVFMGDECARSLQPKPDGECLLSQRSSMAFVYTIASCLFIFFSLPGGIFLDHVGATLTTVIAGLLVSAGFALVAYTNDDNAIAPSFGLVGAGCSLGYSTALKAAFLFRQSSRTLIIAAVNALFDASSLVPLALHTVSSSAAEDPTTRRAVVFYSLSGVSLVLFGLWALAWFSVRREMNLSAQIEKERRSDETAQRSERRSSHGSMDEEQWLLTTPENRWPLRMRPFHKQCRSPQILLVSVWMSLLYVRASFYLSSARGLLRQLGDDEHERYMTILLSMQPLSICLGPLYALAIDRFGHTRVMHVITLLSFVGSALAVVPWLEVQIATFVLMAATRCGMYPTAIGYLATTYGDKTLGSCCGFMFVLIGLSNLLVYPLSLISNSLLGGNVTPVLLGLCVVPTLPQLFVVARLSRLKAGIAPFPREWTALQRELRQQHQTSHTRRS